MSRRLLAFAVDGCRSRSVTVQQSVVRRAPSSVRFASGAARPSASSTTSSSSSRQLAAVGIVALALGSILLQQSKPLALDQQQVTETGQLVDVEDLAAHGPDSKDGTWVVLDGVVWDVTDFLKDHPGGPQLIVDSAGQDISDLFRQMHKPGTFSKIEPRLKRVGKLFVGRVAAKADPLDQEAIARRRDALFSSDFIVNLKDFEEQAKEVLGETSAGWTYYHSWADDGATFDANRSSFSKIRFVPRINVPVQDLNSSTEYLGNGLSVPLPIFCSPTAGHTLAHPDGDFNLTRASAKTGIPQGVSAVASKGIFEVFAERDRIVAQGGRRAPIWYQSYIMADRQEWSRLLKKVAEGRPDAILITVDTVVIGNRESHPLDARRKALAAGTAGRRPPREYDLSTSTKPAIMDANLSWDDVAWVKSLVPNTPVLVKGVAAVADVELAKKHGADGVILSNHGARQLDYAPPPLATLVRLRREKPHLLKDPKFEVYIDGGVTRGSDVVKAVCLGAKGVGLGRTMLYAQACYGEEGVLRACEILAEEIHRDMRLLGAKTLADLKPEMIEVMDGLVGMQEKSA